MATLTLESISQDLYKRLEVRARMHGMSPAAEATAILEKDLQHVDSAALSVQEKLELADKVRNETKGAWITDEIIRAARDEPFLSYLLRTPSRPTIASTFGWRDI